MPVKEESALTDSKTMAYINMYAVLGTLENLCEIDPVASAIISNQKPISIGFDVAGGPKATLYFKNGRCRRSRVAPNATLSFPSAHARSSTALSTAQ